MLVYFVIMGLAEGIWIARIPAVKGRLHLADGLLGASLLVGPAGLVLIMPLAGRLADRFGSARLIRAAGLAVAVLPLALWSAQSLAAVTGSVLAFGIAGGVLSVGLNAQAVRLERGCGRPLMASFHASYSLGGLAGVLLGGLLAWRQAGLLSGLDSVVQGCVTAALIAGHQLLPEPAGVRRGAGSPRHRAGRPPAGSAPGWLFMLGLLALCCVITEGAVGSWSGVYLRDVLATPGWFAGAGFAGFSLAMAAGRLAGDRLAARYGPAGLVRRCGLLAVAGLAGALSTHQAWLAVTGFAACGGGLSCTMPQLLSVAGRANPEHPGRAVARVGSLGYLGLVGGPVLVGGCASLTGLTVALYVTAGLGLCVAGFAYLLDRPQLSGSATWPRVTAGWLGPRVHGPAVHPYGGAMNDKEILGHIDELIKTEHELRAKVADGSLPSDEERAQLRSVEEALDQCWDLLRQRRARREFGEDPGGSAARPVSEVEGYIQ